MKHYKIPEYISCRTYKMGTPNSKTYISNERTHEFVLLEGLSSDLWYLLGHNPDSIEKFILDNNIQEEFSDFIQELISTDLISLNNNGQIINTAQPTPMPISSEETTEHVKLEEEMQRWCYSNGYLWSVFWEMTYQCNQRCIHCFNPEASNRFDKNYISPEELSTAQAKKFIDEMVELGCARLTLSGGEATLRKDLIEIIEYAKSKRLIVELFTNGLALKDEMIDKLASLWVHKVGVSIYSAVPDIHDSITGIAGSFHKSLNTLKKLNKKGIKTVLKSVQMSPNIKTYKATQKLGESIGAAVQIDLSLTPSMDSNNKNSPLDLEVKNEAELLMLYVDKDSPSYLGKLKNFGEKEINDDILNGIICKGGFNTLSINPYGDVNPCNCLPIFLGNIKGQSLQEIWISKNLKNWQNLTVKDFDNCMKYDYCKFCNPCAGMSMLETGSYNNPSSVLCRQAKVKMKAAKLLRNKISLEEICSLYDISIDFGLVN